MSTTLYEVKEPQIGGLCLSRGFRERLAAYVTNPLDYPSAEEIEDHLLDCRDCREFFLTMLKMRSHTTQSKNKAFRNGATDTDQAEVFRLADFRK